MKKYRLNFRSTPWRITFRLIGGLCAALLTAGIPAARGQTPILTTIAEFNGANGASPQSGLTQGRDGNFYGTTYYGGANDLGTVYKMTPSGAITVLHSFNGFDGAQPNANLVEGADGSFYGVTNIGGVHYPTYGAGTEFKITSDGEFTTLSDVSDTFSLCIGNDGNFYGTVPVGSSILSNNGYYSGVGWIFRMTTSGIQTAVYNFTGRDGAYPHANLIQSTDGNLYGTTTGGGVDNSGTIFKTSLNGSFTSLHSFQTDGKYPYGGLIHANDGNYYGMALGGGEAGDGTVFQMTPSGTVTTIYTFHGGDGDLPDGGLIQGSDGNLYGTTTKGGGYRLGSIFKIVLAPAAQTLASVSVSPSSISIYPGDTLQLTATAHDQNGDAMSPQPVFTWAVSGGGTISQSGLFTAGAMPGGPFNVSAAIASISGAATISISGNQPAALDTLYKFDGKAGGALQSTLTFDSNGNLYGTATGGGLDNDVSSFAGSTNGTAFRITPDGYLSLLHAFDRDTGGTPNFGLIQGNDGNLYGTTAYDFDRGGQVESYDSTIFKMTPHGDVVVLHRFTGEGGDNDITLTLGHDGNFYGTASHSISTLGYIFKMTSDGTFTVLKDLAPLNAGLGVRPLGALIQGTDGDFYGTNSNGGPNNHGTIFKITSTGIGTLLHSFNIAEGDRPMGALCQGTDGYFYGTTWDGGAFDFGTVFKISADGSVFTTLHSFNGTEGRWPQSGLIQGNDGNFYGTAAYGGPLSPGAPEGNGVIFQISSNGVFNTVYDFNGLFNGGVRDGGIPVGALVKGSRGSFYGTTSAGTIFKFREPQSLNSITVLPPTALVDAALTVQFTAVAKDQSGNWLAPQPVFTWAVSGGGTIDANGLFTAGSISGGPFTVTATNGSVQGAAAVAVIVPQNLTTISVDPTRTSVAKGHTRQFTAIGKDQNGHLMSPQPAFAWSVSGGGTITSGGLFTAGNTAGGPFTVTASSGAITGTAQVTVRGNFMVDFNGDGKPDLALQNTSSNQVALWYMNGPAVQSGQYLSTTPPAGWKVVGAGDFNGDGKTDLVLQNSSTSQIALWYLNGATVIGGQYLAEALPAGWNVVAVGDFNGDGNLDLALQSASTNQVTFRYLNGASTIGEQPLSMTPPAGWKVVGSADFDNDGNPDLVLQNTLSGRVALWYLSGATLLSAQYVSTTPPAGWSVVGVGDFNNDGKPDLVLQNAQSNQVAFWYVGNAAVMGGSYASITPALAWKAIGTH